MNHRKETMLLLMTETKGEGIATLVQMIRERELTNGDNTLLVSGDIYDF